MQILKIFLSLIVTLANLIFTQSLGGQSSVLSIDLSHSEINKNLGDSSLYTNQVDNFIKNLAK